MIEATGAEIVVRLLEKHGIDLVAGIPGGSVLPLYEELGKSTIRHILVRHEQAGGFLAQGIARSTGKTAVCIATSGPGAMNLLTAIADARCDSVPLVAITGQVNTALIGTDAFQEADTFGLSFPITKHSVMVSSARELLEAIPRAFQIAQEGRPGPVLVDIPRDIQLQKVSFESWPQPIQVEKKAVRFRTDGEAFVRRIDEAARALLAAKQPVLYIGGGCNSSEAAEGIATVRKELPLPVVTSLMGIGAVDAEDPLLAGMIGMHGSMCANRAMYESDLVMAVGVRFDDRATGVIARFCPSARIIHIDIDAAEVNKIMSAAIAIISDAESALPAIAERVREVRREKGTINDSALHDWNTRIRSLKAEEYANDAARASNATQSKSMHPGAFLAALPSCASRAGLSPSDLIITTDVGQHQMWSAQYYPVRTPRTFLTSGSLGTMGFGLPVAIGAALANPDKRVVCISGDGSIMMNIQELATLNELGVNVTVIVLDNGSLGMVRQQQALLFNRHFSASVFESSVDLVAIASGFGITCARAEDEGWEKVAFAGSGPRFVRLAIDPEHMVSPFVPAGKANVEALLL